MTSSLESYMNRMVNVVTGDGRIIIGMLKVGDSERKTTKKHIFNGKSRKSLFFCEKSQKNRKEGFLAEKTFKSIGNFRKTTENMLFMIFAQFSVKNN